MVETDSEIERRAERLVLDWSREDLHGTATPSLRALATLAERIADELRGNHTRTGSTPAPERKDMKRRPPTEKPQTGTCSESGCSRPVRFPKLGLCKPCYNRRWTEQKKAKAQAAQSPASTSPKPNPVRLDAALKPEQIAKQRRMGCTRYQRCVTHAGAENWPGFTCRDCDLGKELAQ